MRLVSSDVIDRPVEEVWNFVCGWRNFPKWDTGGRSVKWVSGQPMQIGSVMRLFRKLGPVEITASVRLIDLEPCRKMAWQHLDWGRGAITRFTFERVSKGTRVTKWPEPPEGSRAPLWINLLSPLLQRSYRRYIPKLKRAMEAAANRP